MATVRINAAAVRTAAVKTSGYHSYAVSRAEALKDAAEAVFKAQEETHNQGRTSETTPPKYLRSWKIEREGDDVFLTNEDPAAMWVEFGAHAGGETPVLRYKPLTRALEIVANSL